MEKKLSSQTADPPTSGIKRVQVVDLSQVTRPLIFGGPFPPAGQYLEFRVEDISVTHEGKRVVRLHGTVRGIANGLRLLGRHDEEEQLLSDYGLHADTPRTPRA